MEYAHTLEAHFQGQGGCLRVKSVEWLLQNLYRPIRKSSYLFQLPETSSDLQRVIAFVGFGFNLCNLRRNDEGGS